MGLFDNLTGGGEDNSPISILKELLNGKDIEMKTDLNIKQIRVLVQFRLYYLLKDPDIKTKDAVDKTLDYYLRLLLSVGRKSRIEATDAVKQMKDSMMENQLAMNNLFNKK